MEGILESKTLTQAIQKIRNIYKEKSEKMETINKEEYESYEQDEREESGNHLVKESPEAKNKIIYLTYYKYLPDRKIACRVVIIDKNQQQTEDFFIFIPDKA